MIQNWKKLGIMVLALAGILLGTMMFMGQDQGFGRHEKGPFHNIARTDPTPIMLLPPAQVAEGRGIASVKYSRKGNFRRADFHDVLKRDGLLVDLIKQKRDPIFETWLPLSNVMAVSQVKYSLSDDGAIWKKLGKFLLIKSPANSGLQVVYNWQSNKLGVFTGKIIARYRGDINSIDQIITGLPLEVSSDWNDIHTAYLVAQNGSDTVDLAHELKKDGRLLNVTYEILSDFVEAK